MSKPVTSTPLLFFRLTWTVVSSSLSSAELSKMVFASTSPSFAATARFSTGFVLSAFRLSSTSSLSMVRLTLPSASGICFSPFTVRLFIVPAPPKSSQLAACSQLSTLVPVNCFVSHLPCATS